MSRKKKQLQPSVTASPKPAPPPAPSFLPWKWVVLAAVAVIGIAVGIVLALREESSDTIALDLADDADDMVVIPGGTFVMGRDDGPADERPAHEVTVGPFQMDRTEVTNAQFAAFVKSTGYLTVAERDPEPRKYPGAPPGKLVPGSAVFYATDAPLHGPWDTPFPPWWRYVPGACWRRPEGKGTTLKGKKDYPVVQICWEDAAAYARWAKKRLPTEAEWEFAARGGLAQKPFCWGDAKQGEGGKFYANTHQGTFPKEDTGADGFKGVAPVRQFPPNGYGLYDMSGNVWEWCSDWYNSRYYASSPRENPPGPLVGEIVREGPEAADEPQRVRRGGSFLCDEGYCRRYLPSARDKNPPDSSANHTGFRCVRDAK
jgi:formylglycine-generating enzyme required for sulfatase activity